MMRLVQELPHHPRDQLELQMEQEPVGEHPMDHWLVQLPLGVETSPNQVLLVVVGFCGQVKRCSAMDH